MPQFFTVRWPLFARLEAALLFPLLCQAISAIEPIRSSINQQLVGPLAPLGMRFGIPTEALFWFGTVIAAIVPYGLLLLVIDRCLTVRRGFAMLSLAAITVWTVVAGRYPELVYRYMPAFLRNVHELTLSQKAMLSVGGLALLLHLRPLWRGLRDDGEIARDLIEARDVWSPRRRSRRESAEDIYYRQTAGFRSWQAQREFDGYGSGGPREHPAVQFIYGLVWVGVMASMGTAYVAWYGFPGFGLGPREVAAEPVVEAGPSKSVASAKAVTPAAAASARLAPRPLPPVPPPANEHLASMAPRPAVAAPSDGNDRPAAEPPPPAAPLAPPAPQRLATMAPLPLPTVNRPTPMPDSVEVEGESTGPNQAVAKRGRDGSFAFDALVNGTHVRMLFDTGASVVELRAEDAERIGIDVDYLTYSAQIRTANGTADVAPVLIDSMVIGDIELHKVQGFVAKHGVLPANLLGQTFLARLAGFNVENNLLILHGH